MSGATLFSPARRHPYALALGAYVLGRLLVLGAALVLGHRDHLGIEQVLAPWDASYYEAIAQGGYASAGLPLRLSPLWAFFPLYPLVGRLGAVASPIAIDGALLVVSNLAGAAATVLGARLVADRYGREVAGRAGIFFGLFPGAIVASLIYADALAVAFALGSLVALGKRRDLLAAVCAAAATASLSLLVVPVVAATAIEAFVARRARAVLVPLGGALGATAYLGYVWFRTGTPLTWARVEHHYWFVRLSLPWHVGTGFYNYPFSTRPSAALIAACVGLAALGLVLLVVRRAPLSWTAWSAVVLGAVTFDGGAWIAPRFLFDAAPLVLFTGASLPRGTRLVTYLCCAAGLVALLLAYSPANRTFFNP